jgi:hypothetical protein
MVGNVSVVNNNFVFMLPQKKYFAFFIYCFVKQKFTLKKKIGRDFNFSFKEFATNIVRSKNLQIIIFIYI